MTGVRELSGQQQGHRLTFNRTALLEDAIVLASFDFEKNRRLGFIIIITKPQFEAILRPIYGRLIRFQIVRIQIQRMHVVRGSRRAQPVIVQFKIASDEISDVRRDLLVDEIFQLKPLGL